MRTDFLLLNALLVFIEAIYQFNQLTNRYTSIYVRACVCILVPFFSPINREFQFNFEMKTGIHCANVSLNTFSYK